MLLLIDNFDSFTYNLVHAFQVLGEEVKVVRNNALSIENCYQLHPNSIVIGPGPGHPNQAELSTELFLLGNPSIPILGICLGHQCLASAFGATIARASRPMHGKTSDIFHDNEGIFKELSQPFIATRYHSLIVKRENLPSCLTISAETSQGEIMGLRHRTLPFEGIQFHPEALLTTEGPKLLANFLVHSSLSLRVSRAG